MIKCYKVSLVFETEAEEGRILDIIAEALKNKQFKYLEIKEVREEGYSSSFTSTFGDIIG
jgi:hypothetical protein